MDGFVDNIEKLTLENDFFRKVLFTCSNSQLVVMSLKPGEDIGEEVHENIDQFLRIEKGEGKAVLNGKETIIKDNWAIVVPAGTRHNIINTSKTESLKLYTVYTPPEHKPGTIHKTKEEALKDHEDHYTP